MEPIPASLEKDRALRPESGNFERCTQRAADDGLRLERIFKNHTKGGGKIFDSHNEKRKSANQENAGHNGNQFFRHRGQTLDSSQKNEAADNDKDNSHNPGGNAKSSLTGRAYGVGLHHAPENLEARVMAMAKKPARNFPERPLKAVVM